jgi:hypothetical protein
VLLPRKTYKVKGTRTELSELSLVPPVPETSPLRAPISIADEAAQPIQAPTWAETQAA